MGKLNSSSILEVREEKNSKMKVRAEKKAVKIQHFLSSEFLCTLLSNKVILPTDVQMLL